MGTNTTTWMVRIGCIVGVAAAAVFLAACDISGLRSDPTDESTRILGRRVWAIVTTDGGRTLVTRRNVRIERGASALDVLAQVADVRLAPDGTIAQVNGLGGGALRTFGPEPAAWFYRVDGIEANIRPDRFRVRPGQSIWWDLRRFDIYQHLPVAVGTFPEPLFSGWRESTRPLRISYGTKHKEDAEFLRDVMFDELDPDLISLSGEGGFGGVGDEKGEEDASADLPVAVRRNRHNLIIARWEEARLDPFVADIGLDPRAYGITVWIEGTEIRRQDPDMEFSERLADAEGLVWASTVDGEPDSTLVYLITGITNEGVRAAVRTLRSGGCQFYIACAVNRDGKVVK